MKRVLAAGSRELLQDFVGFPDDRRHDISGARQIVDDADALARVQRKIIRLISARGRQPDVLLERCLEQRGKHRRLGDVVRSTRERRPRAVRG
jgi:hypothetical protein